MTIPRSTRMPSSAIRGQRVRRLPVPPVAQLVASDGSPPLPASRGEPPPSHLAAIRRARDVLAGSSSDPVGIPVLLDLVEGCIRAYAACDRPVRADLLCALLDSVIVVLEHDPGAAALTRQGADVLASLGLQAPYDVDVLESVAVLRSLVDSGGGFASPHLGLRVSNTLRDLLARVPKSSALRVEECLGPFLRAMVCLSASFMYKAGRGYVAPGVGPAKCRPACALSYGGLTISASSAPVFSAFLTFPGGVSVALDLDALRTLLAVFVTNPTVLGGTYRAASLSKAMGSRPALLRLGTISVPVTPSLFHSLQSLCVELMKDADFVGWTEFRAELFGDI